MGRKQTGAAASGLTDTVTVADLQSILGVKTPVSGNWLAGDMQSGVGAALSFASGLARVHPILLLKPRVVRAFAFRITTSGASGAQFEYAIYGADANNNIAGTPIYSKTGLPSTTGGTLIDTPANPITLPAGLYYLYFGVSATASFWTFPAGYLLAWLGTLLTQNAYTGETSLTVPNYTYGMAFPTFGANNQPTQAASSTPSCPQVMTQAN